MQPCGKQRLLCQDVGGMLEFMIVGSYNDDEDLIVMLSER